MSSAKSARVAATTESDFQSFSTVRLKPLLRFISAECLASFPASSPDIADFVIQLLTANKERVNQMCRGSTGSVLPEMPSNPPGYFPPMGCGSSSHARSEPSARGVDINPKLLTGGDLSHYHRSLQGLSGACKAASPRTSTCVLLPIDPFDFHNFCQACPPRIWTTNS